MPNLLDVYDIYNNYISRDSYFIYCYNKLPSNLRFTTPLEESKESIASVLAFFNFEKFKLEIIFKNWSTGDDKDSDAKEDYPYEYLLKSGAKSLTIWLSYSFKELLVEFLYDASDLELEQEVISMNQSLREKFGMKKTATFKVLSHSSNHFVTEEVKSDFFQVNIEELYNDDFQEINAIIEKTLVQETSGLILLHGAPGTGKTSYIKNLLSKFHEHSFIFIQNEFVQDLLKPDFVSFLLKNRNSILVIEDAEKVITTRENVGENSVVSTILQLTDGLFSDYLNIKIICTFNTNINKVDKALLRKGRLIANYEFKPLSVEKSNKLLQALGHNLNDANMTLADIFNIEKRAFDTNENKKKIGFN